MSCPEIAVKGRRVNDAIQDATRKAVAGHIPFTYEHDDCGKGNQCSCAKPTPLPQIGRANPCKRLPSRLIRSG